MRVTVIHNPSAGAARYAREDLVAAIERAGHEVLYRSTRAKHWRSALDPSTVGDVVVAAGGDGTVDKVGVALAGRGVPMAILPLGTANNISRMMGLSSEVEELIAGWQRATPRPFDVGLVHGVDDEHRFLESVGVGLFPDMIDEKKRHPSVVAGDAELRHDLERMVELATVVPSRHWHVELDGHDLSGEHLAVEAMNIGIVGPSVSLVPRADPGDGLIDVVTIPASARRELTEYLAARLRGEHPSLDFPAARGRKLVFYGELSNLHVDGKLVRENTLQTRVLTVHVGIWMHALEILV